MVISRLISIKILWESFHLNISIKGEPQTEFVIIFQGSYIIIFPVLCHLPIFVCSLNQGFLADHLSGVQGKLSGSQLLQNHSRRDHRQVWLSHVTCQNLQLSSHNPGVMMTCWCQSFVIKPNDIPKALLCYLASKPDQYQ